MAPVAGMLAAGKKPAELARPIRDPLLLNIRPAKPPVKSGKIIHIDHFGNATTNIPRDSLKSLDKLTIKVGRKQIGRLKRTYTDAAPGTALALFGSSGLLEIAVRDGSAEKSLRLRVGDEVTLSNRR